MDSDILKVTSSTVQFLTLHNTSGQTFNISKATNEISIIDIDGNITNLITQDSKFRKFMLDFLK